MLIYIVDKIFLIYTLMLFGRILGSWIPDLQGSRFMQFISFYTDPYLNFFRKFIPPLGMMDLSPIVAIFALSFIERGVKSALYFVLS